MHVEQHVRQIGVHYPIANFRLLRPSKKARFNAAIRSALRNTL
jgi:hypothetical protein